MARKRHLASSARGFCGFCLTPATELIRPIRPIRGKKSSGVLPSRQLLWYAIYTEGDAPGYS